MEGCKYRKAFAMSLKSAPFPIKRRVSLTNFSMKRSIDMEKTITTRFLVSSLNIALWTIMVPVLFNNKSFSFNK